MAGNIWGEGPRGGIFGARVDPALLRELEKRAAEKRNEIERSTLGGRAKQWWDQSTFFKPAYEELVGAATLPGDVMSGAQPTMSADPQTGEMHTDPRLIERTANAAGSLTLGSGMIPAEVNALRMGASAVKSGMKPKTIEVGGVKLPLNSDGTVTLYHGTTEAGEAGIRSSGRLTSGAEPDVYLTTAREGTGYGDRSVPVRVDPKLLQIDDQFPGGRADFRLPSGSSVGLEKAHKK